MAAALTSADDRVLRVGDTNGVHVVVVRRHVLVEMVRHEDVPLSLDRSFVL